MLTMPSDELMRAEIIELIDSHTNNWVKAAFYSDPEVSRIMARLVSEWESKGQDGQPIDYATSEELVILLRAARKYYRMDARTAMAVAFSNMNRESEEEEEAGPGIMGVFRRLFSRGRQGASP